MVDVYISSDFLKGLLKIPVESSSYLFDILKKFAPYVLHLDIPEEEIKQLEINHGLPILKLITKETTTYKISPTLFSIGFIEAEYINKKIHHSKFFLVCNTPEEADSLRRKHSLFFSSPTSFQKDHEEFFLQPPKSLTLSELSVGLKNSPLAFAKWGDITKRISCSPFLFLSDRYCALNTAKDPVEPNLASLLADFIDKQNTDIVPHITLNIPAKNLKNSENNLNNISKADLEQMIAKKTNRKFHLKIHALTETEKKRSNIKDKTRCIATSYYFLESADSFNYFNEDGTIKTKKFSIRIMPIFIESVGHYYIKDFYNCFNTFLLREGKTLN